MELKNKQKIFLNSNSPMPNFTNIKPQGASSLFQDRLGRKEESPGQDSRATTLKRKAREYLKSNSVKIIPLKLTL